MAKRSPSPLANLATAPAVREAARALVAAVAEESSRRLLPGDAYLKAVKKLGQMRGRGLFLPLLTAGPGRGARVRLADGSTKLDFIGGIGVYGFGHSDADLLETAAIAAATDTAFQGHLAPGPEYFRLSELLLKHSGRRLRHVWLSLSGAMANENALKIIQHKHAPADRIVVFEGAFAGRTSTLAELTDKPGMRKGLPLRGNVLHVPFFDPEDPASTLRSVKALEAHLARYPGQVAGMLFELVQGEGGFNTAPREFFVALMECCRAAGIAVWVDEVQTFGRTGELFAFRTFELETLVDVVTVGKFLQGSAVLFRAPYNPDPALIAGTYAGSSSGMAMGARIIERLDSEGYLGTEGRINVLGRRVARRFESLQKRMPRAVGPRSGIGAMQAFVPWDGDPKLVRAVIDAAFEAGLIVFPAGSNPMKIRMLLPVNVTDEELESGFVILEKALRQVGEERELSC
ncbi:MAG: aminotransferase class III-fold pyridoxal phosphate-dependent enzyme [Myxococcales bacterium]|nr:aminotransferase class III-fold pyridoxal phosphate-dependent enzyme [Myxococcales bacterium]